MTARGDAPLAVTMGEPAGVGGEIALAAWRALRRTGPIFFAIDDPFRLSTLGAPVQSIESAADAKRVFRDRLPVLSVGGQVAAIPGRIEGADQQWVLRSIRMAVDETLSGGAGGVVTNPVEKSALIASGFEFSGHTEYLGALTAGVPMPDRFRRRGPVMMLAAPGLKTVPVTIHMPLAAAAAALTTEAVVNAALVVEEALRMDFGIKHPRLAVAGLNPHAGEKGALGKEDDAVIAPAIERLRALGVTAAGPLSADAMFHEEARRAYDAAICMYHDQALIPVKTIAFHEAVNVTLGLPIVRTSPDHGTALDIAGKGVARPDSLIAAIRLAAEIAARRARA